MPRRYASSAPSAPSTGVQTLPQPRRDAMVIGERYVPDRRWKAGWRSSHGEKGQQGNHWDAVKEDDGVLFDSPR